MLRNILISTLCLGASLLWADDKSAHGDTDQELQAQRFFAPGTKEGPYVEIVGKGRFVCVFRNEITQWPIIARAASRDESKTLAQTECLSSPQGNKAKCSFKECEESESEAPNTSIEKLNRNLPPVGLRADIPNADRKIKRYIFRAGSPQSAHVFQVESSTRAFQYQAMAETEIEARALAMQLCLSDSGLEGGEKCDEKPLFSNKPKPEPRALKLPSFPRRIDIEIRKK
ncbi:hypothetical protein GW915_01690 [bacterium]|nr:hypothetical protein [bacterium]